MVLSQVPHLTTALSGPLHDLEQHILSAQTIIEAWLREQWRSYKLPFYASVDLRNAGFKLAPVDTNLFPAGFNNLNPEFTPLCIQAIQSTLENLYKGCLRLLLIPEDHTRNLFYLESLIVLQSILSKAGFEVRLGSLRPNSSQLVLPSGQELQLEPIERVGNRLRLKDFNPCVIILNNDLASGIPAILQGIEQPITPPVALGWAQRLKSQHFHYYHQVCDEFAELLKIDPWVINPLFRQCQNVNFIEREGEVCLIENAEQLFAEIQNKYAKYHIPHRPFIVVKADAGTYGMGVMSITDPEQLRNLNRKERTRMATSKGNLAINKVILQEGVYSFETWGKENAVAEPVIYMIGPYVVGGFYRVHKNRSETENLNAPGMQFEPLAFVESCNNPDYFLDPNECPNRFYAYGVIARLALVAAAREIKGST